MLLSIPARHALPVPACACTMRPRAAPSRAGFEDFTRTGGSLLLEQGRLALAQEFVKAMADMGASANIFGVLLSGPNGVGESALRSA